MEALRSAYGCLRFVPHNLRQYPHRFDHLGSRIEWSQRRHMMHSDRKLTAPVSKRATSRPHVTRPQPVTCRASNIAVTRARFISHSDPPIGPAIEARTRFGVRRIRRFIIGIFSLLIFGTGYLYITDTRAGIHRLVPYILRAASPDAEAAHEIGNAALHFLYSWGLHPRERPHGRLSENTQDSQHFSELEGQWSEEDLAITVFGRRLDSPVGLSAGIDKKAEIPDALFALGAAIVEVGGVTPLPQEGNPKPRVWRLPSQNGLINRYGLNSPGVDVIANVLRNRAQTIRARWRLSREEEDDVLSGRSTDLPPGSLQPGKLLAVQIAKNKDTPDGNIRAIVSDYVKCVEKLGPYADILVVNVSSPNTPGLRGLQAVGPLTEILTDVVRAAQRIERIERPRVMVKVSPDEDSDTQVLGVCDAVWRSGVDGIIVGNTTKQRPPPLPKGTVLTAQESQIFAEQGGYSGPQLFERTVALVKRYRNMLDNGVPDHAQEKSSPKGEAQKQETIQDDTVDEPKVIFATGGITNGEQVLQVLEAGANVAQMYTALVYGGAGTITRVKQELRRSLAEKAREAIS